MKYVRDFTEPNSRMYVTIVKETSVFLVNL